jgi:hypothetical protein
MTDIAALCKAELLKLIEPLVPLINPRAIARARWLAAADEARRLDDIAWASEEARDAAASKHLADYGNVKLLALRSEAATIASRARNAADRARSREKRLWEELQSHFPTEAS